MLKKILSFSILSPLLLIAQPSGTPEAAPNESAEQADPFAFLPDVVATVGEEKITKTQILEAIQDNTARFTHLLSKGHCEQYSQNFEGNPADVVQPFAWLLGK